MNVTMPDGTVVQNVPDDYTKEQVLSLYEKQKPKSIDQVAPEMSTGEKIKGGVRSFLEGQTFGFADELGSGLAAIPASIATGQPYGDVYRQMQEEYQRQQKRFEEQNPKTAAGLNIAGGFATAVPGLKSLYGSKFAQINPVKTASLTGMGMGALGGTGYAPTMEDVPEYAAGGAVAGGLLGPAGYYAGKLGGKAYQGLKGLIRPESPQTTTARTVGTYLGQDDLTPEQLIKAGQAMGPEATLADVGGENLKSLAMTTAQMKGAQKTPAKQYYAGRQKGATKRIMNSLKSLSGGDEKFFSNQKAIIDKRYKEASPLYEAAKKESLTTDDVVDIYNRAQSVAGDFEGVKPILNKFTKGKGDHKKFKTSIRELHSLQRELRDEANAAFNKGRSERGNAIMAIQKDVINTISQKNPNYAAGRKIWADESALNDALKAGRNILKEDADMVSDNIANLSKSEQEAYISGAVKTIRDKLMVGRESSNTATKLASQLVRERLRGAFPDDASFNNFINRLDVEDEFAQTYQKIYGGSQTQPRQIAEQELSQTIKGKGVPMQGGDVATKVINAARSVLDMDNIPQPVVDDITRLMATPIKDIPAKELKALQKYGVSKADLNKIKGYVSGSIGGTSVSETQRRISR